MDDSRAVGDAELRPVQAGELPADSGPQASVPRPRPPGLRGIWSLIAIPIAAVVLGVLLGGLVIFMATWFATGRPDVALPFRAYQSLAEGAGLFGNVNGIVNSLVQAAPLTLGGLAVGVGFKAGLFNIGAQGQFLMGALAAASVGAAVAGQPAPVAILVAVLAAAALGAFWGFIPGLLKAATGAHEVVTTIMLNFIAGTLIGYLITGPLGAPGFSFARTGPIGNATLPVIFGRNLHLGVIFAFIAVPIVWYLLYRTTIGFEIRTVGANPNAARYAGMRPGRLVVMTLSLCGMFAGIAGAGQILGISGFMNASYGTTIGFDSISVALLGRAHPVGILLAALLFGAMRAGSGLMQIQAGIPVEIIDVIQALILLFLAADIIVRRVLRVRARGVAVDELQTVTRSYGEQTAP
jgi:ABC-type uncharacterized transport system permease subunit